MALEREKVTGILIEPHSDRMGPPDAQISRLRIMDADILLLGIETKLRNHEDVTVIVFPSDDPTLGETHKVFLSD